MTRSEIARIEFTRQAVRTWAAQDGRHLNWPVVYVLERKPLHVGGRMREQLHDVYVGETLNAAGRLRQHLDAVDKRHLTTIRVLLDETFNKSVCLDLESHLIRLLAGDGKYRVLNRNDGVTDADYYDRDRYRATFQEIFDELSRDGVFSRTIPEIENSDLFKFSPFKALTQDQAFAVEDILEGIVEDLRAGAGSTVVVEGAPGTGKTVIAVYLLKLLADLGSEIAPDDITPDTVFSDFFVPDVQELLAGLRVAFVVPQQSLRESIRRVFRKTPGLRPAMVLTPFQVGEAEEHFDLLIVDETHRLNQRANQPSGPQNRKFSEITQRLFGWDDLTKTQLDWIRAKSTHQIFLLDEAQSVRPADLPPSTLKALVADARSTDRVFRLTSQLRVKGGTDYVAFVRGLLTPQPEVPSRPPQAASFQGYDLRFFDDLAEMRDAIERKDSEVGLARVVAGYAWPWVSRNDPARFDIEIDGCSFRWNSTQTDWIASPGSVGEVGSIHTVQGYDLNYAGVIIGPDLRFDAVEGRLRVDRASYHDKKGKENNPVLGKTYTDDDLLRFITNIYGVLLTRGMLGTFVYVCDPALRRHLRTLIGSAVAR